MDETLDLALNAGHSEIHLPDARVTGEFVARAHEAGVAVLAYTVNDAVRARELEAMGLDGIFTDDPKGIHSDRASSW